MHTVTCKHDFFPISQTNSNYLQRGYTLLNEYSTQTCASKCDAIDGCAAFNIYFERDPTLNPNDASCKNPPSTTNIKVSFCNIVFLLERC